MKEKDLFIANEIFPDSRLIFSQELPPVEELIESCIFVLDTNALLVPFSTSGKSLKEIQQVYSRLKNEKRIYIPGQVAREFATNRPEKLKQLFSQIKRKQNSVATVELGKYPVLSESADYQLLENLEEKINQDIDQYRKRISGLLRTIQEWRWNDPVSSMYKNLFTSDLVYEIDLTDNKTTDEMLKRYNHSIPPGYKDKGKEDQGIGDYIIWKSILEIGEKNSSHIVFISGDEKSDWFYQSEKQALYPRFELVAEFSHKCAGKSFHIIRFSKFLELFGAPQDTVKEVEKGEEEQSKTTRNYRRTINILIENQLLKKGESVFLKKYLPSPIKFDPKDPTFNAIVTGKLGQSDSFLWAKDQQEYSISALTSKIFEELTEEEQPPINGNVHWVNSGEISLWQLANQYLSEE